MKKRPPILPFITLLLLAAVFCIGLFAMRNDIIINYGIRKWSIARTAVFANLIICGAWTVAAIMRSRKRPDPVSRIPDPPEKKSFDESDRNALYAELKAFADGKWQGVAGTDVLLSQLDSMNEYQEQLGPLLEQTDYLKQDPAQIVQRVEDCMYVNIRKLLNYMRIIQIKSKTVMSEKIRECTEKNADLLKKTDDFVVAVVGYVNGDMAPGEEEKTKDYVDNYMFVVLQAIELPEAYLR